MANTVDDLFNEGIAKQRKKLGYSQTKVTKHMQKSGFDWNSMTLSRVERGQRKITVGEAIALAQYFNMGIPEIAGLGKTKNDVVDDLIYDYSELPAYAENVYVHLMSLSAQIKQVETCIKLMDDNHEDDYRFDIFGSYDDAKELLEKSLFALATYSEKAMSDLLSELEDLYHNPKFITFLNNAPRRKEIERHLVFHLTGYATDKNGDFYISDDSSKGVA